MIVATQGYLTMSGDALGLLQGEGDATGTVGRGRPTRHKTAPMTKHYLAPNINCEEAEEACIRLRSLCRASADQSL